MAFRRYSDDDDFVDYAPDDDSEGTSRMGALPAKSAREITKRREAGEKLEPVLPTATLDLSTSFWGRAWNKHLMAYADHESRMPKGRTDFRKGRVMDVEIAPGMVTAVVAGQRLYEVRITVGPVDDERWADLRQRCLGGVVNVADLLTGELSDDILTVLAAPESGIFPLRQEMRTVCNCPDDAGLCQHAAAVLYAIGARLDEQPQLLFTLRRAEPADLIADTSQVIQNLTESPQQSEDRAQALEGIDLGALFGLGENGNGADEPRTNQ